MILINCSQDYVVQHVHVHVVQYGGLCCLNGDVVGSMISSSNVGIWVWV